MERAKVDEIATFNLITEDLEGIKTPLSEERLKYEREMSCSVGSLVERSDPVSICCVWVPLGGI